MYLGGFLKCRYPQIIQIIDHLSTETHGFGHTHFKKPHWNPFVYLFQGVNHSFRDGWYPLVNVYITMERSTIFNGKTHYFDWAMFYVAFCMFTRPGHFNLEANQLQHHQTIWLGEPRPWLPSSGDFFLCSGIFTPPLGCVELEIVQPFFGRCTRTNMQFPSRKRTNQNDVWPGPRPKTLASIFPCVCLSDWCEFEPSKGLPKSKALKWVSPALEGAPRLREKKHQLHPGQRAIVTPIQEIFTRGPAKFPVLKVSSGSSTAGNISNHLNYRMIIRVYQGSMWNNWPFTKRTNSGCLVFGNPHVFGPCRCSSFFCWETQCHKPT